MDTTKRFSQLQLVAWLGLSYLLAAMAAAGVVYLAPFGWPPAGQLLAGVLLGLTAGLLLSLPLGRAVEIAAAALAQLSRGQVIAPLPLDWQRRWGPLGDLLSLVDALGARERELAQIREDLVRSTGQAAAQAERNRLARDLHDSIKQQLYAINVSAAAALARWESDLAGARAAVEDVRRAAQAALAEMAALLQQLRPAPLAAAGLLDALREQCEALAHRTGAVVAVDLGQPADAAAYAAAVDDQRLAPGAEEAIFRIAQEALNNVARHARASHVTLRLRVDGDALRLEIADDGQGFGPVATGEVGGGDRSGAGYGLAGMRDRAVAIGAVLDRGERACQWDARHTHHAAGAAGSATGGGHGRRSEAAGARWEHDALAGAGCRRPGGRVRPGPDPSAGRRQPRTGAAVRHPGADPGQRSCRHGGLVTGAALHVEPDAAPWDGPSLHLAVASRGSQPPDVGLSDRCVPPARGADPTGLAAVSRCGAGDRAALRLLGRTANRAHLPGYGSLLVSPDLPRIAGRARPGLEPALCAADGPGCDHPRLPVPAVRRRARAAGLAAVARTGH